MSEGGGREGRGVMEGGGEAVLGTRIFRNQWGIDKSPSKQSSQRCIIYGLQFFCLLLMPVSPKNSIPALKIMMRCLRAC